MATTGFWLIIISALAHVMWNAFLKSTRDKTSAIAIMMLITVVVLVIYTAALGEMDHVFNLPVMLTALASGFFFFLYQFFVAKSYANGDLSAVYPLTVTGPIYIPLWGYLFLDERISLIGFVGIVIILYGAVSIQANCLSFSRWRRIGATGGASFALLAAFFYSFGAVADKVGVTVGVVSAYTLNVCVFMLILHMGWMVWSRSGGNFLREIRLQPWVLLAGGFTLAISILTFRYGLQDVPASYATALRQVSSLFSILIGFFIFRETFGITRVLATALIIMGVVLIRMG